MFSKQWEQTFLMWQLFTVNSWNNSAVLHRSLEEKVRAPWTGSLGSTRQSAFTRHPCRQFQLFYTNQQVYISPSAWPPLKCWSALSLSWVFCYPDKAPLFHLQGWNGCLCKTTLFSDLELSPTNEPGMMLKNETLQQEIHINASCSVSVLLVLALCE